MNQNGLSGKESAAEIEHGVGSHICERPPFGLRVNYRMINGKDIIVSSIAPTQKPDWRE